MLMHQLKRLESPNFMIINHDASSLPNFRIDITENSSSQLYYDRILADVPCSGNSSQININKHNNIIKIIFFYYIFRRW